MNTIFNLIIVVQVLSALAIIGLVLLQHGKGADMGAAFGSGASGSLFGASGSSNFLSRSTGVAAAVFFAATLALALFGNKRHEADNVGVMENLPTQSSTVNSVPVQAAPAAASPAPAEGPAQSEAKPADPAAKAGQIPK